MRSKLAFLIVLQILLISVVTLPATDLRGRVDGYNPYTFMTGPLPGVAVGLFVQMPNGGFTLVRQTVTGADGFYYLQGIYPGYYVLQIGGINYPLGVGSMPLQDIPVIYR
jgi:hypothetical protein